MRSVLAVGFALALTMQAPVARARILGIAHLAVFVSDLNAARGFYKDFLGFDEPFTVARQDGAVDAAFVKINDRQWIELFNGRTPAKGSSITSPSTPTTRRGCASIWASRGVTVPETVGAGPTGDKSFTVTDPDGHTVEIVEYQRDGRTGKDGGKHLPATRISERALHVGILVGELAHVEEFYNGILGFKEFWRGSAAKSQTLSWVNMRVPDGTDYLEFMLYDQKPAPDRRGTRASSLPDGPGRGRRRWRRSRRARRARAIRGRSRCAPASTASARSTCSIPTARVSS